MFNEQPNMFSDQRQNVTKQLDDGIRVLQGQVHKRKKDLHFCHTSCNFLDAGPIADYFSDVADWVNLHPNDVVSIILVNFENVSPSSYVDSLEASGLSSLAYVPPKYPMALGDWPTLGEMIDSDSEAAEIMYVANHNLNALVKVPYSSEPILFPSWPDLSDTNALEGFGSLGTAVTTCIELWQRPPNFLLVDFYDVGSGSVFEVAAMANNVTYYGSCSD
ncbi:hypothetical protein GP486_000406 [Trichoglossum hirsutum]|uniref:PLC-like phosphodiesterase n=1 Tax=Trichoglossum hirsutum TaxID=265104 RepID=A0A9P8RU01_9PEZI|nr:hypothetical protein GP486_000406 [Trichoglossum hirsutum]